MNKLWMLAYESNSVYEPASYNLNFFWTSFLIARNKIIDLTLNSFYILGAAGTSTTAGATDAAAVQPVARQIITGPPNATPIGGIAAGVQDQGKFTNKTSINFSAYHRLK